MTEPAWVEHAIWWQVYPLGFVGAFPAEVGATPDEHRLRRIVEWLDHAIELGASGIALGPIFASRTHGYDTTDHYRVDPRLGDDSDLDHLITEAHRRGLRVLLDGVFNHVGTDFAHTSWFRKRGNNFDTFEGHGELIALDHDNPEVVDYTVDVMSHWLRRGADGWRLDAAYAVPDRFWARVLPRVRQGFGDAWFVGEVIHGDYSARVRESGFDSVTQYELWKAIWSSLNDGNFHELDWALVRHNEFLERIRPDDLRRQSRRHPDRQPPGEHPAPRARARHPADGRRHPERVCGRRVRLPRRQGRASRRRRRRAARIHHSPNGSRRAGP
jgi:glycosidase